MNLVVLVCGLIVGLLFSVVISVWVCCSVLLKLLIWKNSSSLLLGVVMVGLCSDGWLCVF